jgi:hypothetical protein
MARAQLPAIARLACTLREGVADAPLDAEWVEVTLFEKEREDEREVRTSASSTCR